MTASKRIDPAAGGFPTGLAQPALRALAGARITTVDQLAEWREADVASLHGMGPKAMRILRDALALRGRSFRA